MAKKTLSDILACPVDFLYLWASDEFIAQLGSRSKIIKSKKYNQYQTLWRTMVDNEHSDDLNDLQVTYAEWTTQIADAIVSTYGMSPAQILQKLALGEEVLGKNWNKGIYGIGEVQSTFSQNTAVTVDAVTGKIKVNGTEAANQTRIFGEGGAIVGYSYYDRTANRQYQSGVSASGEYGAVCYSSPNGVETATGGNFDPSKGSFWQNANNYMPLVNQIFDWIKSLIDSLTNGSRVVLTDENTLPDQTEWVEAENDNGGLVASGLGLAALLFLTMDKPKGKKKNKA